MFELFEHKADIGIRGFGKSLEGAFEETAKAMFSVMVDLGEVEKEAEVKVAAVGTDNGSLLVNFLNELLFQRDVNEMLFADFKVKKIEKKEKELYLKASAIGEKINLEKHNIKTEVKAATYSQLEVGEKEDKYFAQCIVDV